MIIYWILILFIQSAYPWQVIYEASLPTAVDCSNKLSDNYWSTNGNIISSCQQNSCKLSSGSKVVYVLQKQNNNIQVSIPMPSNLSSIYYQFGVDALVYIDSSISLSIQINNYAAQSISPLIKSVYSENYSFTCGSATNYFQKVSSSVTQSIGSTLTAKFIKSATNKDFAIKYLRIWASCAKNCSVCNQQDDCNTCFSGLQRYIFAETGKGACETTENCNIANCFSCAISSTRTVCLKCFAGYTLTSLNSCTANASGSCSTGQYKTTTGTCLAYTTNCYYQDSTGNYQNCNGVEDVTQYKCQNTEFIYILNYFNYNIVRCGCNDPNCTTCPNNTTCSTCNTGYSYNSSTNKCDKICTISGTYYDSSTSTCKNCTDTNCESCTSAANCSYCKTNYVLDLNLNICTLNINCPTNQFYNSSTLQCQNCPNGCQLCSASNQCTQCQSNLIWDSSLNYCKPCISPQVYDTITSTCITCQSQCIMCNSNQCISCTDNTYQIDTNNIHQCIRIPLNCASNQYYDPINYTCVNCSTNCLTCSSTTCQACLDNSYQIDSSDNKKCTRIPLSCASNQYYDSVNYVCVNCSTNCLTCDSTACQACLDNTYQIDTSNIHQCIRIPLNCSSNQYYDSVNYICVNCSTNCLTCNSTSCQTCLDSSYQVDSSDNKKCTRIPLSCASNQYYDSASYVCVNCSINCLTCNSTTCLTCLDSSYQIDTNNIHQCIRIPLNCASNQYYDPVNYICVNCSTNCLTCNSTTCQTCLDSSYQVDSSDNKKCTRIPLNCSSNQYYDSVNYTCTNCSTNCLTCNSTICMSCLDNTYQIDSNDNQKCVRIPLNCSSNEYYDSINYTCVQCNQNCSQCDLNQCISCVDNTYYIDPNNSKSCIKAPINCQLNEYYDSQSLSCQLCSQNCSSCNKNQCLQCINTTFVVDNSNKSDCIQRPCSQNCSICNDQKCLTCVNNNFTFDQNSPLDCILVQQCSVLNCTTCVSNNIHKCTVCQEGYFLNDNQECTLKCNVQNCQQCEANSATTCKQCKTYFIINQEKTCSAVCQMKNCTQCQENQPFQCKSCLNDYLLHSTEYFCYQADYSINTFIIKQSKKGSNENIYLFQIIFTKDLIESLEFYERNKKILIVFIENRNDYTYFYNQTNSNEILIEMYIENEIKNSEVQISFQSDQFQLENKLDSQNKNIDLLPYVKVSASNQKAGQQVSSVANGVTTSVASSFMPIVIISNFYVLVNTIDITGFYYYLLFINVRLPENVTSYFAIFQNFQFPFIPNMFQDMINPNFVLYSPICFQKNGNQGYFITNAGQSMTICSCIAALYLLTRIGMIIPVRSINQYLTRAVQRTWHYSAIFDMFCTVYIYVIFAIFLQFYEFNFDDKLSFVNYSLFVACSIIFIGLPFFIFLKFYQCKNVKADTQFQQKYSTLLSGLKQYNEEDTIAQQQVESSYLMRRKRESQVQSIFTVDTKRVSSLNNYRQGDLELAPSSKLSSQIYPSSQQISLSTRQKHQIKYTKYYAGICYLRKLLFALIITYLFNQQYLQLALISLLNVFMIAYFIYINPFEKKSEKIKLILGEISLIMIQSCIYLLISDKNGQSEDERYNIGWIIISVSGFILLWNTVQLITELLLASFKSVKSLIFKNRKPSIKVQCIDDKLQKQQQIDSNDLQQFGDINPKNSSPELCPTNDEYKSTIPNNLQDKKQQNSFQNYNQYFENQVLMSPVSIDANDMKTLLNTQTPAISPLIDQNAFNLNRKGQQILISQSHSNQGTPPTVRRQRLSAQISQVDNKLLSPNFNYTFQARKRIRSLQGSQTEQKDLIQSQQIDDYQLK